jgi:hypothetical protein
MKHHAEAPMLSIGSDLLEVSADAGPEDLEEVHSLLRQQQQKPECDACFAGRQPRQPLVSLAAGSHMWSADVHAGGGGGDVAPRAVLGMGLYRLAARVRFGLVRLAGVY